MRTVKQKLEYQKIQCTQIAPESGYRCMFAEGHAGPHRITFPGNTLDFAYYPDESWVTKCTDKECVYHDKLSGEGMCISCGHKISKEEYAILHQREQEAYKRRLSCPKRKKPNHTFGCVGCNQGHPVKCPLELY